MLPHIQRGSLSNMRDLSIQANICSDPSSQRVSVPMDYVGFLGASHLIQAVIFTVFLMEEGDTLFPGKKRCWGRKGKMRGARVFSGIPLYRLCTDLQLLSKDRNSYQELQKDRENKLKFRWCHLKFPCSVTLCVCLRHEKVREGQGRKEGLCV